MEKLRTLDGNSIGDIYTGKVYQQHYSSGRLGNINQLSYCVATDGVRLGGSCIK